MDNIVVAKHIPVKISVENSVSESEENFQGISVRGETSNLDIKNIHICFAETSTRKGHFLSFEFIEPVLVLFFSVTGNSMIRNTGDNTRYFEKNVHNVLYCPERMYLSNPENVGNTAETLHIILPETYFLEMVDQAFPALDDFKTHIRNKEYYWLCVENMPITPEMLSIIREIKTCSRKGVLKTLFVKAKTIKLLMLQLEQLEHINLKQKVSIRPNDLRKINHAKQLIDENMSTPLSLGELARRTGLNDFKLKKGFKEVYGFTVFGYLTDVKMREAKKLLLREQYSITEIATICGYRQVQNFSTAFRKKFDITPDKFRALTKEV